jgi:drug/metabolite transporter (DMT)-like permease
MPLRFSSAPLPDSFVRVTARAESRPIGFTGTDALCVLMVTLWGLNFIVLKAALPAFQSPLAFNAVRFTLAALAVGVVAWLSGARRPPNRFMGPLLMMGLVGNFAYQLAFIDGVAHTRAGNAALIMAAIPVQTAVMSHLSGHERLRRRDVAGLALSAAGIATIVLGGGLEVGFEGTLRGDLVTLLSTLCWSAYTVGTKPLADTLGPMAATAWTMGFGAVPLLLVTLPAALAQDWSEVGAAAWGGVAYSSLGALVVAYLIWYRAVSRLGPARTAVYSNFTPVVAVLAAWPLLGEVPTAWQVLGAGGIFTGITLTRT